MGDSSSYFELSILIGADYYWTFVEDQVIRGKGPTAVASKLGYLLSGSLSRAYSQTSTASFFHVSVQSSVETTSLEQFWNLVSWNATNNRRPRQTAS